MMSCDMSIAAVYWCIIVFIFCTGCCPCSPDSDW